MRRLLFVLLMLALAACGGSTPPPGPDLDAVASQVSGTLQAAATFTAAAAPTEAPTATSEPEPTATSEPDPTATFTPEPTPTQEEGRINLAAGSTNGVVTGRVEANQRVTFRASAAANQIIIANLQNRGNAILEIKGADGSTVLDEARRFTSWRTLLTKTQDYEFTVIGGSSAQDFTLSVAFAVPVNFASGNNSASYTGRTVGGNPVTYTIYVQAGKQLTLTLNTSPNDATLTVWPFNDDNPTVRAQDGRTSYTTTVSAAGYYIIEVFPQGGRTVDYTVTIAIP